MRRQSSGLKALKADMIARGELPDIKKAKAALKRGEPIQKNKTPFACQQCDQKSWGKPGLATVCEPCLTRKLEAAGLTATAIDDLLNGVRIQDTSSVEPLAAAAE